ncbi:unnamed protein product [Candidula unifasciata]|uniref:NXPE C-terminal domain-containing protein n=1 Tax=Candidula unifasciata TaxID=100452 RepID=A0A8S4A8G8_9EUPU|nr:unnamed protein product [Candidula unifasciata]
MQTQAAVKYDFNMHASYRLQVLQTEMSRLARNAACASVMADPVSFWRSQRSNSTNFTAATDLKRLQVAERCETIPIAGFLKTPPMPFLYSFEKPYLEDPPVTDILKVSNESTSSVVLVNSSSSFFIGETVALLITVRDREGNPKTKGGDDVRAWFTDVSSSNSTLPAKITDYGNGTYLARAVLAFVGTFRACAILAYSREYLQTVLTNHLMVKSTLIFLGVFSNSLANETSVCCHVPVIPGVNQSEICNLTEVNGTPWFCGHPVKPWLKCTDYIRTRKLKTPLTMPMNNAEKLLFSMDIKKFTIPAASDITLNVSVGKDNKRLTRLTSSTNCSAISPRQTWEQPEPTGYMYKGLWHPYFCRRPESFTKSCLRNVHILFLGDSNGRQLYEDISPRSSCQEQIKKGYKAWHKPLKCISKDLNFTLEWIPHSNPFRATDTGWAELEWIKASNKVIDEIPNTGRCLVHIHHYLHTACTHLSAYIHMMTAIKESLVRLLKRNPSVVVVIQGPHVIWQSGSRAACTKLDSQRLFYTTVLLELFKDMRDQVFYLQTSDMTIASHNNDNHPPLKWQISNMLTGFICGRQW